LIISTLYTLINICHLYPFSASTIFQHKGDEIIEEVGNSMDLRTWKKTKKRKDRRFGIQYERRNREYLDEDILLAIVILIGFWGYIS